MKWRPYFHTALKCVLSILVTKVSLLFIQPHLPSPSLAEGSCSCLSVVVCLWRPLPPAFSSCELCFSSYFFHCSTSLFLIKVKKKKQRQIPLPLSLNCMSQRRHFIWLYPSIAPLTFRSSLFRPHGSLKTSSSVFVELSGRNILKRYRLPLCYNHCKTTFLFGWVCRSMQSFNPVILQPLWVPAVEITDVPI